MRQMPSRLLTEWMAYFRIENEDRVEAELKAKAEADVKQIRAKRKNK